MSVEGPYLFAKSTTDWYMDSKDAKPPQLPKDVSNVLHVIFVSHVAAHYVNCDDRKKTFSYCVQYLRFDRPRLLVCVPVLPCNDRTA